MLADPESAVSFEFIVCNLLSFYILDKSSQHLDSSAVFFQVDVACGKYGAAKGMGPGKGYDLLLLCSGNCKVWTLLLHL